MQGSGTVMLRARLRGLRAKIKGSRYLLPIAAVVFTISDLLLFHSGLFSGFFRRRSVRESDDVDSYLINTPGCVIQNFDVLSPELTKFVKGYPKSFQCGDKRDLTESAGLMLFLYQDRAADYGLAPSDIECNYKKVIPRTDKEGFINVRST
nr:uncharacterized protein LOC113808230 [Penaeus vannamei]